MPDDGMIDEPEFQYDRPKPPPKVLPPRPPFKYEKVLDKVRLRPREYAKVATFTEGGRKECYRRCRNDRAAIDRWLKKRFPLEEWDVFERATPDTWGDKELWVIFWGEKTVEEALKLSELRQQFHNVHFGKGYDRQARRHVTALLKERRTVVRERMRTTLGL